MAVIAGGDATQDIKDATAYVETTDDGDQQIDDAITAGYRVLYLVGTVTAEDVVSISETSALAIEGAPGALLDGDLTIDAAGDPITLDVTVTGTVSDTYDRIVRPAYGPTAHKALRKHPSPGTSGTVELDSDYQRANIVMTADITALTFTGTGTIELAVDHTATPYAITPGTGARWAEAAPSERYALLVAAYDPHLSEYIIHIASEFAS